MYILEKMYLLSYINIYIYISTCTKFVVIEDNVLTSVYLRHCRTSQWKRSTNSPHHVSDKNQFTSLFAAFVFTSAFIIVEAFLVSLFFCTALLLLKNSISNFQFYVSCRTLHVRVGTDKSLARSTSRCRTLERGVCSCAELQVFSCYRG